MLWNVVGSSSYLTTFERSASPYVYVVDLHFPFAASNVGALSRGPRELRERVGRAEALSASNSPSEFCALQLPNASVNSYIVPFFYVVARGRGVQLIVNIFFRAAEPLF